MRFFSKPYWQYKSIIFAPLLCRAHRAWCSRRQQTGHQVKYSYSFPRLSDLTGAHRSRSESSHKIYGTHLSECHRCMLGKTTFCLKWSWWVGCWCHWQLSQRAPLRGLCLSLASLYLGFSNLNDRGPFLCEPQESCKAHWTAVVIFQVGLPWWQLYWSWNKDDLWFFPEKILGDKLNFPLRMHQRDIKVNLFEKDHSLTQTCTFCWQTYTFQFTDNIM